MTNYLNAEELQKYYDERSQIEEPKSNEEKKESNTNYRPKDLDYGVNQQTQPSMDSV